MRSHISVRRATTKYFSNSFVFKTRVEKERLPGDITPGLGAGGPRFGSGRPDHLFVTYVSGRSRLFSMRRFQNVRDFKFKRQISPLTLIVIDPELVRRPIGTRKSGLQSCWLGHPSMSQK